MQPFALLHRDGADHVEVLTGDVVTVATLADIPLPAGPARDARRWSPTGRSPNAASPASTTARPLECLRVDRATRRRRSPTVAAPAR